MTYAYDPELAPMLPFIPALDLADPAATRAQFDATIAALNAELDESGVVVENRAIPGPSPDQQLPLRIYRPENLSGKTAGLLFIHGGGFVFGNLDSEHASCLSLCRDLGIVLVSVDYRLAPEHPYPAALDDCYGALEWTAEHSDELGIDANRVGIFGQSAGGGLSAATALLARDRGGPAICFQYLGIPELDDRLNTPSMRAFSDTPLWNLPCAEYSWRYYLGEAMAPGSEQVPCYAAPARAEDLSGLPPAMVTTMEFDPLRDEGIEFALRLLQAGVSVELHHYPGTFHGSALFAGAVISQREAADCRAALRRGLALETSNE